MIIARHTGSWSICTVLQVAPSGYYARLAVRADPAKGSARQRTDAVLRPKIQKVWDDNWQVYGVRKAWRQLCREGEAVARCTVARLMAGMGLRGIVRGKAVKTTIPDASVPCPRDKVSRQFRAPAPNMLWVSDFTYVSTWQPSGVGKAKAVGHFGDGDPFRFGGAHGLACRFEPRLSDCQQGSRFSEIAKGELQAAHAAPCGGHLMHRIRRLDMGAYVRFGTS